MEAPRSIYVAFEAFPRPKGSSSHIASMVAALARRWGPVWLLCCGYGDMPAFQQEGDVVVWRHKLYHPNMLRRAVSFGEFVEEKVRAAGDGVRLVVFRDPWGGAPALGACDGAGTIFEVNALPSWELPYAYPAFRRSCALRAKVGDLERFCLKEADRLIVVSPVTKGALENLDAPPERISVVPNAASEVFHQVRPEDCPIPELVEGRWFGYFGSLHPWQGVETAVDAFALVAADLPEARLLIVHNGRKAPLKALKKRVRRAGLEERTLLHRPLPPEELAAAAARLRFTVAPLAETARNTLQGCCPVKIVESMAAGTPVVASDLRVCRDLVTHEKDGLLVRPGDRRAWARAFLRLLADDALAARLAEGAVRTAAERFTWAGAHAKLDHIFTEVAEAAEGPRPGAPGGSTPPGD